MWPSESASRSASSSTFFARGVNGIWPGRDLVALADDARHLGAHLLDRDVEALEHARGETLLLAQQAEQDVLGADVVVLQRAGLVLREDDDLAGSFCESLEQPSPPSFRVATSYGSGQVE